MSTPLKNHSALKPASVASATELLEAMPDPVLATTAEGVVTYCNPAAEIFLATSRKNIIGRALHDYIDVPLQNDKSLTLRDIQINDRFVESLALLPIENGFMLTLRLPPEHVKTALADKARDALRPAQLIARTLAHEIKNPLAGISGAAQLLGKLDLGVDDKELLTLITRETDRIKRLVEKVNIFDDVPQNLYKDINIHAALEQAVAITRAASPSIKIDERYDPSLPDINGHFDHMVQVFLNMLKNATESGADKISLRTYYDTAAGYHPKHHHKVPFCIEIEDNGHGMDAQTLPRVFELYFTTKATGDGFGLSIVSKIIDDHGGLIDITSRPQKTVFKICLPMGKSV